MKSETELGRLRAGEKLTLSQQLRMIITLSVPAIFSQISSIIMQYIDASMVGRLGADASASIGLVFLQHMAGKRRLFRCGGWLYSTDCPSDRRGKGQGSPGDCPPGTAERVLLCAGYVSGCLRRQRSSAGLAGGRGNLRGMPALTFLYLPCFFPCSR